MAAEFLNVVFALIAGLIAGMCLHSAWLHSKLRKELSWRAIWSHPDGVEVPDLEQESDEGD